MKSQSTPEEAWVYWRQYHWNTLKSVGGDRVQTAVPKEKLADAEKYAVQKARLYLEHITSKLQTIAAEAGSGARVAPTVAKPALG